MFTALIALESTDNTYNRRSHAKRHDIRQMLLDAARGRLMTLFTVVVDGALSWRAA